MAKGVKLGCQVWSTNLFTIVSCSPSKVSLHYDKIKIVFRKRNSMMGEMETSHYFARIGMITNDFAKAELASMPIFVITGQFWPQLLQIKLAGVDE